MNSIRIGIDLGTTTISLVSVDAVTEELLVQTTVLSESTLPSKEHVLQDPQSILEKAVSSLNKMIKQFPNVSVIGLTGQMHGILYLNQQGEAISPLYTWQDLSAELQKGICYRDKAFACCGETAPSGYGLMTHYVLHCQGKVPAGASTFCTIADYLGMRLTGRTKPCLHISNAAALGFFDLVSGKFKHEVLERLGIDIALLPPCTGQSEMLGRFQNIPVSVAIGDNQAAFLGAVDDPEHAILMNIGTGSQISMLTDEQVKHPALEIRPFVDGNYLCSYSALCGGDAYAVLERFFRMIAREMTGEDTPQYELMAKLAACKVPPLTVDTAFRGTRLQPELRGAIQGLSTDNFTPEALVRGVLAGMVEELYQQFENMPKPQHVTHLVASGNGIRRNPVLQELCAARFHLPLTIPDCPEEAALGASRFAALCR